MLPAKLTAAHFADYPPEARALAVAHLALLQQMPLSLLPSLLREVIEYDTRFPAERAEIERQLAYLASLGAGERTELFANFAGIRLSPAQQSLDWVRQPLAFTEQLAAYLWSTHQMDTFHAAATTYGNRMQASTAGAPPPMHRLGIAVIGQGAPPGKTPLFHKLREHGTFFSSIKPDGGLGDLLDTVTARAQACPVPYGHWYIDGGEPAAHDAQLTAVSYQALAPVRNRLLDRVQEEVSKPGMGPEALRNTMARLCPRDLGMEGDPVLDRFQLQVFTEGSGTQIFSTTFAQWTAREVLRRAQPLTMLVRFAPRQRQRPMNELLTKNAGPLELDPAGSLIDADMAAYYQWINQGRLVGAEQSSFLVWFEGQSEAVAICSSLPRGTSSTTPMSVKALLQIITA